MILRYRPTVLLGFVLLVASCYSEQPLHEDDWPLLVTFDDVSRLGVINLEDQERYESTRRVIWPDGSIDIEYEFSSERREIRIISVAEFELTVEDAQERYRNDIAGFRTGVWIASGEVVEQEVPYLLGDESYFGSIQMEDQKLGDLLITRDGSKIFGLLVSGHNIGTAMWTDLILPRLEYLHSYNPLEET